MTNAPATFEKSPSNIDRRPRRTRLIRKRIAEARQCLPYARLVRPMSSRIAYIGWLGHQNMGDEVMYESYKRLLPWARFCTIPTVAEQRWLRLIDSVTPTRVLTAVALGGGTLVGRPSHRRHLENILRAVPGTFAFTIGVGVEDPDFDGPRVGTSLGELRQWGLILQDFDTVTVRGPRSKEILENMGIASEVVGDPALALADNAPYTSVRNRLLGLNVGVTKELWGGDSSSVLEWAIDLGRTMVKRGWRIRLIPAWSKDVPFVERVAKGVGTEVEVLSDFLNPSLLMQSLRECEVFVGEKLHSVVMASGAYVPSISLEYRPKCLDFQESLGRAEYSIRTDKLDLGRAVAMIDDLSENRDEHQRHLLNAVTALRGRIEAAAKEVTDRLATG